MGTLWDTVGWSASGPQCSPQSWVFKIHIADLQDKASFAGMGQASAFCPAESAKASGKFQILNGGSPPSPWAMPILSRVASMTSHLHCAQPEAIKLPLLLGMDFRLEMRLSRECPTHPRLLPSQPPALKAGERRQRG